MDFINIVSATNDNFAKYLSVMLVSILENKAETSRIKIHIIYSDLSQINRTNIANSLKKYDTELEFICVNPSKYIDLNETSHISKETYFRLDIPNLLPLKTMKAIYLDCDLIVKKDISELWNTDVGSYFIGAVEDSLGYKRWSELGIPENGYFNAGVLILDLKKWREHKIADKVLAYLQANPSLKWLDQDALNVILKNKWFKLNISWNYQTATIKRLKINPGIIHYTGKRKPWKHEHPLQQEYLHYELLTNFDS